MRSTIETIRMFFGGLLFIVAVKVLGARNFTQLFISILMESENERTKQCASQHE